MTYNCKIEKDGEWYVACYPDMMNVQTCAETYAKVIKMAEEALNSTLTICLEKDFPIPMPTDCEGEPIEVAPKIAFAINLRYARADRTKKEAASLTGMSYQQYQCLENPEKTNPTLEMIFRLQKAFGHQFLAI